MKNESAIRTEESGRASASSASQIDVEVSKVGIGVIGFVSALIGIWGIACFVGGLVNSGGPFSFVKNWFGAVLGF